MTDADRIRKDLEHVASLTLSKAAQDVIAERRRQIKVEGWTPEHDDEHFNGEMATAAACYAIGQIITIKGSVARRTPDWSLWPWNMKWWKPKDRRRDLVRAAALLIAEIERIDRVEEHS